MSDLVTPGETNAAIDARSAGGAWANAGHAWIVDGADLSPHYSSLDDGAMDGFRYATSSGLTVTIAAGEAYVAGWLARDRTTSVDLPAGETTRVYVGYDAGAILADTETPPESENVIIGPESAFDAGDPRTPLYDFTTDADTVTGRTDHRQLEKPVSFDPIDTAVDVNVPTFRVSGSALATEDYVDQRRYTDAEAREAITAAEIPGGTVEMPNVNGYTDGLLMGPDLDSAYSHMNGETTIYAIQDDGAIRFRNHVGPGDLLRVDNQNGNGWVLGDWTADGLMSNADGEGLVPRVLGSNESLPDDTVTGRIIYDPSREET